MSNSSISSVRLHPRLVVTDLDGTLLDPSHNVSRRSAEALAFVQRQPWVSTATTITTNGQSNYSRQDHIQVMIASGRSPRSVQKVIDQLHGLLIPDAVLCLNGSLSYNPVTRAVTFPQFLPHDAVVRAVRAIQDEIINYRRHEDDDQHDPCLNPAVNKEDKTDSRRTDPKIGGIPRDQRPGFSCEVIWDDQDLEHPGKDQDPTTFVCDRVWEHHRRHTIYYDYMGVDSMVAFLESLRGGPDGRARKGHVLKLLVLDRTRTAGELFNSLPESIRGRGHSETTTGAGAGAGSATSTIATLQEDARTKEEKDLSELLAITYSGPSFIEITRAGVHKGLGLETYCRGHKIDRRDVVAFGDWLNDYEMLTFAGLGCVMGNGHPDLQQLAAAGGVMHATDGRKNVMRVIGSNAEDGLAAEMESWFS